MSSPLDKAIALSISTAPDAAKLGMPDDEMKRALLAVTTAILRRGLHVLYSGHLNATGYTNDILVHVGNAYGSRGDQAIISLLPESELVKLTFEKAVAAQRAAKGAARFLVMRGLKPVEIAFDGSALIVDPDGLVRRIQSVQAFEAWKAELPPDAPTPELLTRARTFGSVQALGRIAMGGKMGIIGNEDDQYGGAMPGIAEEAILTIESGKALVLLGAFGGCTRDIAIALGLMPETERVPRSAQAESYGLAIKWLEAFRPRLVGDRVRLSTIACSEYPTLMAKDILSIFA